MRYFDNAILNTLVLVHVFVAVLIYLASKVTKVTDEQARWACEVLDIYSMGGGPHTVAEWAGVCAIFSMVGFFIGTTVSTVVTTLLY